MAPCIKNTFSNLAGPIKPQFMLKVLETLKFQNIKDIVNK